MYGCACAFPFFFSSRWKWKFPERVNETDPVEPVPCHPWSSRASKMTQPNLDYMGTYTLSLSHSHTHRLIINFHNKLSSFSLWPWWLFLINLSNDLIVHSFIVFVLIHVVSVRKCGNLYDAFAMDSPPKHVEYKNVCAFVKAETQYIFHVIEIEKFKVGQGLHSSESKREREMVRKTCVCLVWKSNGAELCVLFSWKKWE